MVYFIDSIPITLADQSLYVGLEIQEGSPLDSANIRNVKIEIIIDTMEEEYKKTNFITNI